MKNIPKKLSRFAQKNRLFSVVLVLFIIFTSYYAVHSTVNTTPDESYHLAAIKTFARQYSPFVTSQTDISESNDMIRYPSYLYHYLLSFPYRLLDMTDLSDRSVLVVMRLLNVMLGVVTLLTLRRLLLKLTRPHIADTVLALFALVPMTLIIYGGLNYDNLLLLITFLSAELLLSLYQKPNLSKCIGLAVLLMLGALTKFSFLPVMLVIGVTFLYVCYRHRRRIFVKQIVTKWFVLLCLFALLVTGLFVERYGVNVVKYKSVNPSCKVAHSLEKCNTFPINLRNETAANSGVKGEDSLPVFAVNNWMRYMIEGAVHPVNKAALRYAIILFIIASGIAVVVWRKAGYKEKYIGVAAIACASTYTIILFINNLNIYRSLGLPLAINGRYVLPALPFLLIPAVASIAFGLQKLRLVGRRTNR